MSKLGFPGIANVQVLHADLKLEVPVDCFGPGLFWRSDGRVGQCLIHLGEQYQMPTYCVNFHVGGLGSSTATIFFDTAQQLQAKCSASLTPRPNASMVLLTVGQIAKGRPKMAVRIKRTVSEDEEWEGVRDLRGCDKALARLPRSRRNDSRDELGSAQTRRHKAYNTEPVQVAVVVLDRVSMSLAAKDRSRPPRA